MSALAKETTSLNDLGLVSVTSVHGDKFYLALDDVNNFNKNRFLAFNCNGEPLSKNGHTVLLHRNNILTVGGVITNKKAERIGHLILLIVSNQYGYDDYSVFNHPQGIHRIKLLPSLKKGDIFNAYSGSSTKTGVVWHGTIEESLHDNCIGD